MTDIGFGIFCTNADGSLSTNHTFRLKNLSFERVFESFQANLRDFLNLLELCRERNIEVFRLGSNFIPYASHVDFRQDWLSKFETYIIEAGKLIKEKFNIRITMHPGQFVILNSPHLKVLENSIRELEYHFWILDKMGVEDDGVVIIHIGGAYGQKERAVDRFIENVDRHNWLKRRLAVENDERLFNAQEVLKIAETLRIPFVFDFFHHRLNPSEIDLKQVFDTWGSKEIPKVHLSSRGIGKIVTHGDYVDLEDFLSFQEMIESTGIKKVHMMIEAKRKEKAIENLRNLSMSRGGFEPPTR